MTFSILALVSSRDSHISPRRSRELIWVEGWYQGQYGKGCHVLLFLSYTSNISIWATMKHNFEILWTFWIFWNFEICLKFWKFWNFGKFWTLKRRHRQYRKCLAREAQYGNSFTRGWIWIFSLSFCSDIWYCNILTIRNSV